MYKSYFLGAHIPSQGPGWPQAYTLVTEWLARSMSDHQSKSSLVHVRSYRSRDVFMRAAIKQNRIHCLILHPSRANRTLLTESRTVFTRHAEVHHQTGQSSHYKRVLIVLPFFDVDSIIAMSFDLRQSPDRNCWLEHTWIRSYIKNWRPSYSDEKEQLLE